MKVREMENGKTVPFIDLILLEEGDVVVDEDGDVIESPTKSNLLSRSTSRPILDLEFEIWEVLGREDRHTASRPITGSLRLTRSSRANERCFWAFCGVWYADGEGGRAANDSHAVTVSVSALFVESLPVPLSSSHKYSRSLLKNCRLNM